MGVSRLGARTTLPSSVIGRGRREVVGLHRRGIVTPAGTFWQHFDASPSPISRAMRHFGMNSASGRIAGGMDHGCWWNCRSRSASIFLILSGCHNFSNPLTHLACIRGPGRLKLRRLRQIERSLFPRSRLTTPGSVARVGPALEPARSDIPTREQDTGVLASGAGFADLRSAEFGGDPRILSGRAIPFQSRLPIWHVRGKETVGRSRLGLALDRSSVAAYLGNVAAPRRPTELPPRLEARLAPTQVVRAWAVSRSPRPGARFRADLKTERFELCPP